MSTDYAPVQMTQEMVNNFLAQMESKGRGKASIDGYRRILMELYDYLPEGKELNDETGQNWLAHLEQRSLSPRTINVRISVWNSFMLYIARRGWQMDDFRNIEMGNQPELSREEYVRMLCTARQMEDERTYLLIKMLGGAGVHSQELPQLTVEAVEEGSMRLESHNQKTSRVLRLPALLRRELLKYAEAHSILSGPIFITSTGRPIGRGQMNRLILRVGQIAQVDEEKSNPRCLWKMYQVTQNKLWDDISQMQRDAYDKMLGAEQQQIDDSQL